MIQPRFATMLCFVQTDAALDAGDRRPAARRDASSARSTASRVDGQLSTNDTAILMASGASGVARRARERGRAALRRGARRAAAPARAADRRATARARSGSAASSCAAATTETVERVARAVANSPLVKTALHGGDPNWGRIAQAVGAALPDAAPLRVRHRDRGRAGRASPAPACRYDARGARRGASRATRSSTTSALPGRGRRDRGLLLRPRPRLRDDQRGVHDLTDAIEHARRRHPPRGAALHPRVPRPDRRHQVRRRGDGRPASCARSSRATSCCSSTSA